MRRLRLGTFGERCCRIGLAPTSLWFFQAVDVPALVMPSCAFVSKHSKNKKQTISHLPGMAGEANDAVSAHTGQNEGHSQISQGSGDGMLPNWEYGSIAIVVQQTGAKSMTQEVPWKAMTSASRQQVCCGSEHWRTYHCKKIRERLEVGNVCTSIEQQHSSCRRHYDGRSHRQLGSHVG